MRIGITFDLKGNAPLPGGAPDDFFEEFDDPSTVAAIADALRELGHEPIELGDGPEMVRRILDDPPDFVFNFAEGQGAGRSREARVPAVLELLHIPFTGSDPATLGVCLDKDWTRRMVESVGVPTPHAMTIAFGKDVPDDLAALTEALEESGLELPVLAKPVCEGSSKGIRSKCLIERPGDFAGTVVELWQAYRQPVLIEEFIDGDELTVGIIGNDRPEVLGIMRVVPRKPTGPFIYSLEVKRDWRNLVDYECPAQISESDAAAVRGAAIEAYDVLGCRDVARLDFRLRDGVPYFIEANPLPGLNPVSGDIVLLAGFVGVGHTELIGRILQAAIDRQPQQSLIGQR
jgi:D-alanine-D-alanine ligase